ncbi:MAG TPA: gephyrin-like molybdotransferase Glp [Terriglobales bacterium]|jgi:molybdopterin molybdotransferase
MSALPEPAPVLSFEDARHVVEDHASRLRVPGKEVVDLLEAGGRVLAEAINADRDFPPFARAARDGYAVRTADLDKIPKTLTVAGEIRAGSRLEDLPMIGPGKAASIMTGAPAPRGADAVVMVEYTSASGGQVEVVRAVSAGENIVPAGSEARRGERLLSPGSWLDEAGIALAASVGRTRLVVYEKPRVGVLSTGDEVVDVDVTPGPHQIRNSNSYSLATQILAAGAEPVLLPVAPDERDRLRELISDGLEGDLLLLAGGVSMGQYDLVEQVLTEMGAEFFFTGAQIQPGRPVVFGRVQGKYFFGLPGNPVSTMVTFELFARPMLERLGGMAPRKLIFLSARLKSEIRTKTGLKRFLPAVLAGEFERAEVELAGWHGSGDVAAVARANCYVVVPPDRERLAPGEWVAVLRR